MKKSITLVELLLASAVMGVVVSLAVSLDATARRLMKSSDLTVMTMNEASYVIEHIQRNLSLAHGYISTAGTFTGLNPSPPFTDQQQLQIRRDGGDLYSTADDYLVTYRLNGNSVEYIVGGNTEILSPNHIVLFRFDAPAPGNPVVVTVRARYFPVFAADPKTNPEVELSTVIYLTQHSAS